MKSKNYTYNIFGVDSPDLEWEKAAAAKEKPQYYFCGMINGGECVKCYKPSLAEVVKKRHAFRYMKMIPTTKPEKKRRGFNREQRKRNKGYYQPYGYFERSMAGLY